MATGTDLHAHPGRIRSPASSGWQVAWGVLLIISGIVAILIPVVAALATGLLFGWLLIIGGASELAYAFHMRSEPGFAWKLASGIVTLVLGILVLVAPLAGAASLAVLVGAFLFVGGVARIALAIQLRHQRGWGWVLFDGLLSIVIAALIVSGWPESSIAFIGLMTGFWLVWAGIWRLMLPRTQP